MLNFGNLGLYLLVGLGGGWIGQRTRISGGTIIGAMAAVIFLRLIMHQDWNLPRPMMFIIQVLVGIMVGATFTPAMLGYFSKIALPVLISTVYLVLAGIILAYIFNRLGLLDIPTAYLGTSPGGMSALIAIAAETGANATVVAAFHFFRIVFVILTAPVVYHVWSHLLNRPGQ